MYKLRRNKSKFSTWAKIGEFRVTLGTDKAPQQACRQNHQGGEYTCHGDRDTWRYSGCANPEFKYIKSFPGSSISVALVTEDLAELATTTGVYLRLGALARNLFDTNAPRMHYVRQIMSLLLGQLISKLTKSRARSGLMHNKVSSHFETRSDISMRTHIYMILSQIINQQRPHRGWSSCPY